MVSIKLDKLTRWDSFPKSSSVYPDLKVHAVDDLVVDWDRIYAQFRESLKSRPIIVGYPSKPKPAPSFKSDPEMPSGSSEVFMPPAISPAFWDFVFYPTIRAGRGPAQVKTTLDMSYAVNSKHCM